MKIQNDIIFFIHINFQIMAKYTAKIPKYGDILPIEDYIFDVSCHALMDCDGFGHPISAGRMDDKIYIYPSNSGQDIPEDADSIIWFNK